jgi:protein O-GlcNAc transferase
MRTSMIKDRNPPLSAPGLRTRLWTVFRNWRRGPDANPANPVAEHGADESEQIRTRLLASLDKNPHNPALLNDLGQLLLKMKLPAEAEQHFRHALRVAPTFNAARSNLGQALRLLGNLADAEQALQEAVRADPADAIARNRLGTVLRERGRSAEAESCYRAALLLTPGDADILNNLGAVLSEQDRVAEAEQCFRDAVKSNPSDAMAQCNLGLLLADLGRQKEAEPYFLAAVNADPGYFYARISYVMNKLTVIHDSEAEAERARVGYREALQELRDWFPLDDAEMVAAAAEAIGWVAPFYLAYQGKNDRDLQALYGGLVCDIMARRYPDLAQPLAMPPLSDGEPLRIGIASAFFSDHSNWKTPIRGWIENIDPKRFRIFGYYTGFKSDRDTAAARQACHQFVEGLPFEPLARKIRADALHVLIFPEIGMDPAITKLATLRLAPVQCNSWGHPDTSGMPTVDYYLSSDLMEPENGQDRYTEQLVRLPNISIHYTQPRYDAPSLSRNDFGFLDDKVLYCCAQSLFKYLPQFDALFPRIARRVDNAQFVFFASQKSQVLTEQFTRRLTREFEKAGLDAARHLIFMPRMNIGSFQAASRVCDVYLDSVEWSGCNTTLETLAMNLPVITMRGSAMRGRHTYAFLKMMGMDELIADDLDSYVELAARLGLDPSLREQIKREIPARLPRLHGDLACIQGLERFLVQAVGSHTPAPR